MPKPGNLKGAGRISGKKAVGAAGGGRKVNCCGGRMFQACWGITAGCGGRMAGRLKAGGGGSTLGTLKAGGGGGRIAEKLKDGWGRTAGAGGRTAAGGGGRTAGGGGSTAEKLNGEEMTPGPDRANSVGGRAYAGERGT